MQKQEKVAEFGYYKVPYHPLPQPRVTQIPTNLQQAFGLPAQVSVLGTAPGCLGPAFAVVQDVDGVCHPLYLFYIRQPAGVARSAPSRIFSASE